jgi:glutamate racemase
MLDQGVDRVVMGCTHYPFVIPLIQEILGEGVEVIDPAPAVTRQVGRLLEKSNLFAEKDREGNLQFLTTGENRELSRILEDLLGIENQAESLIWVGGKLTRPAC